MEGEQKLRKKSWGNLRGQIPSEQVVSHLMKGTVCPQTVGSRAPQPAPFLSVFARGCPVEGGPYLQQNWAQGDTTTSSAWNRPSSAASFSPPSLATACSALRVSLRGRGLSVISGGCYTTVPSPPPAPPPQSLLTRPFSCLLLSWLIFEE